MRHTGNTVALPFIYNHLLSCHVSCHLSACQPNSHGIIAPQWKDKKGRAIPAYASASSTGWPTQSTHSIADKLSQSSPASLIIGAAIDPRVSLSFLPSPWTLSTQATPSRASLPVYGFSWDSHVRKLLSACCCFSLNSSLSALAMLSNQQTSSFYQLLSKSSASLSPEQQQQHADIVKALAVSEQDIADRFVSLPWGTELGSEDLKDMDGQVGSVQLVLYTLCVVVIVLRTVLYSQLGLELSFAHLLADALHSHPALSNLAKDNVVDFLSLNIGALQALRSQNNGRESRAYLVALRLLDAALPGVCVVRLIMCLLLLVPSMQLSCCFLACRYCISLLTCMAVRC